jgi:TetR/AcrR family transcriptional regulator, transcriptional repressor for nem operon
MKVTRQEKSEHRERIIAAASRRFREKGFDGISVADLMKEVGLTHGGFYGHFSSKEELMALAAQHAIRETGARWKQVMDASPDRPLEAFVEYYLTAKHQAHPGTGCLLAALGSDLARQPDSVKAAVMEETQHLLDLLATVVPGRTKAAKRKQAIAVLSQIVGALILARSVCDPEKSAEILRASSDMQVSA